MINEITLGGLLADIHFLNKELTTLEQKYGLLSEVFYEWYTQGDEPEDEIWLTDLAEWAGLYKSRQRLVKEYQRILTQQLGMDKQTIIRRIQFQRQAIAA